MNDEQCECGAKDSEPRSNDLLSVGDWRLWTYGFVEHEWYVYQILGDKVKIGKRSWLVSSAMWIDKDMFIKTSTPIGKGKFRWWWLFLPFVNDVICPFSKGI